MHLMGGVLHLSRLCFIGCMVVPIPLEEQQWPLSHVTNDLMLQDRALYVQQQQP